jgi:hypothetical protein
MKRRGYYGKKGVINWPLGSQTLVKRNGDGNTVRKFKTKIKNEGVS